MPSKECIRLEWNKVLIRKELPKKVFVCSEHFIDGKPTDRNPYPKLKLGYEIKATTGRRKKLRQDYAVKKRKFNDDSSDSDMGTFLQSKLRWFEKIATGNLSTLFHRYDLFAVNNPIPDTGYQLYR
jgi:hypothetical protein